MASYALLSSLSQLKGPCVFFGEREVGTKEEELFVLNFLDGCQVQRLTCFLNRVSVKPEERI
jgi:hypothetical protein